jgi:hypothetical protein
MAHELLIFLVLGSTTLLSLMLWIWILTNIKNFGKQRQEEQQILNNIVTDVNFIKDDIKSLTSKLNKV